MRKRRLIAFFLCVCLVLALAAPALAEGELSWDGGPPFIVDDEREYIGLDAILERPNFPAIESGEDESFTAVLCGETMRASVRNFVRSDAESYDGVFKDFSGTTWSWYPIELYDYADYLSEWCEWTPISGYTNQSGYVHFWKADVCLTEPGFTCLRVDVRKAVYDSDELIGSVHDLDFCGSLEVYGFGGSDPSPVQAGTAAPLNLFFREPLKKGGSKEVPVSSVSALSDCEFAYTLESAVRADGTVFTEDELAAAAEGLDTSSFPATFTPSEAGTYSWRVDVANRPGAYPARINVTAAADGMPAVSLQRTDLARVRYHEGVPYIIFNDHYVMLGAPRDQIKGHKVKLNSFLSLKRGWSAQAYHADGSPYPKEGSAPSSGDTIVIANENGSVTAHILIMSDPYGNGQFSIGLLTKMARSLRGDADAVPPPYLWCLDYNGNDKIDLTDLIYQSRIMQSS